MNIEILKGKTCLIGDTCFEDIDVKTKHVAGHVEYYIQGIQVKKFDLGIAISIQEELVREANKPKGINSLGIFFVKRTCDDSDKDRGTLFSISSGIRKYGFNKCGVFFMVRLCKTSFELDFCWRDKQEYLDGNFPDSSVKYVKIF